jgi:hypothetical protein
MEKKQLRERLQEIRNRLDDIPFVFPDPIDEGGELLREAIRITSAAGFEDSNLRITLNDEYKVYRMSATKSRATRKGAADAWKWFISDFNTDLNSLLFFLSHGEESN